MPPIEKKKIVSMNIFWILAIIVIAIIIMSLVLGFRGTEHLLFVQF